MLLSTKSQILNDSSSDLLVISLWYKMFWFDGKKQIIYLDLLGVYCSFIHKTPVTQKEKKNTIDYLLDAWLHRVSAKTGWPSVSILLLGETASFICNFNLIVVA